MRHSAGKLLKEVSLGDEVYIKEVGFGIQPLQEHFVHARSEEYI